jgi:hypothetical protein
MIVQNPGPVYEADGGGGVSSRGGVAPPMTITSRPVGAKAGAAGIV